MNFKKYTFLLTLLFLFSCTSTPKTPPPSVVEKVDLSRYLGAWYEAASFPQWFQKDCFCTRAYYSQKNSEQVGVLNTCNKNSTDGKLSTADGYAKIADTKTNAKLKVTFFWPFFGDYWIIGLDKDYRYVVVSNPDRSTLWILSRTPVMPPELYNEAFEIAKNQGLDLTKLVKHENEKCQYPEMK